MNTKGKILNSFSKNLALILSWIILSPLFLFLSVKWNKPKLLGRIILTLIAPFTLITISFISWHGYEYYYYQIKRGSITEIEAKTGMEFPECKTIKKRRRTYGPSFNSDFIMNYSVQLDTTDITSFYQQIEEAIESSNTQENNSLYYYWDMDNKGNFSFSHNDYQEHLELNINTQTGEMDITYGSL